MTTHRTALHPCPWRPEAARPTPCPGRGKGVYVGILDAGLLYTWPQFFPAVRIATQYATSFVGGGARGSENSRHGCSFDDSITAAGLLYFAQLEDGPLANAPPVVNNSWGRRRT